MSTSLACPDGLAAGGAGDTGQASTLSASSPIQYIFPGNPPPTPQHRCSFKVKST